ncbi:MAG: 2-oxoacid:ferredoxin oxidoreductase subunit beta [Myxococcales bacterium]|nr:2-oxoacid:ferredoxin oxidoreductase subunit beta [Myxococcales bacterium]MDD9970098.1 2-oxoacid:ferredoxin oxidoreductase subunit beta [Myxococcales bacterium]
MAHSVYPAVTHTDPSGQTKKDFASDVDPRWCPGCGDYSILAQVQKVLPGLGIPKENYVFVSGIGCSSRFPYYMDTYGIHSIHGRGPAFATGIKSQRPDLSVWLITGDGDGLSIGGNHFIHLMRRNVDVNVLLFNNRIYGLTKGQYSPTSQLGTKAKSTPMGSIDYPLDPIHVALGAGATFVARTLDTHLKHLPEILKRGAEHKGTSFIEIYQNCPIFNDGEFVQLTDKTRREDTTLELEHGKPMRFGKQREKGIVLDGSLNPQVVDVAEVGEDRLMVFDETNEMCSLVVSRLTGPDVPTPIGVMRAVERPTYEHLLNEQLTTAGHAAGKGVQDLLNQGKWVVT